MCTVLYNSLVNSPVLVDVEVKGLNTLHFNTHYKCNKMVNKQWYTITIDCSNIKDGIICYII